MEFRYDFLGDKLDLTRFSKQAPHYIAVMREVTFNLYLPSYKMKVEVATPDNCNGHTVSVYFYQIERDEDGEILSARVIIPLIDTRFKELRDIQDIWRIDHYKAHFDSNSTALTIEKVSKILKIIFKIERLKAFL